MRSQTFSHVAIGVLDMERALRFYRDVIGLVISYDAMEDFPANGSVAAMTRRGVYLRWRQEEESFLVLDERRRDGISPAKRLTDTGIHHFGFWVDSVDEVRRRAVENDVEIMVEPLDCDTILYGEPSGGLVKTLVLRDPDGNVIQLDQRVSMPVA